MKITLYLDQAGRHPLLARQDEIEFSQAYRQGLDAQRKLADTAPDDPARPELEAIAERGEWARRRMIESPTCAWWSPSPAASPPPGCRWGIWCRRATWGCCGRWRSSTGARAASSPPTPPWWIRQAIARGARAIRLPVHVDEQIGQLWRTQARLYELLGQEPSDEALADELDMAVEKVQRLKDAAQAIASLDSPIGDGAALQDLLEDDTASAPMSWS
jgi:hypothetical protein